MITMNNGAEIKRFDDFGFDVELDHTNPSTAKTKQRTLAIPGKVGLWDFGIEIEAKEFNFNLKMHERRYEVAQENFNQLVLFLFDSRGKPKELEIIFDYELDKFYKVKVNGDLSVDRDEFEKVMPINFIAFDPNKYSIIKQSELYWDSEVLTLGSFVYFMDDKGASASTQITASTVLDIEVLGQDVKPYINITGTGTSIMIRCGDGYVNVGTHAASTTIGIDCERFVAYINGVETMLDMNEFWLKRGSNDVSIIGVNMNFTVSFDYRDKWL